jgi:hypothetical protein
MVARPTSAPGTFEMAESEGRRLPLEAAVDVFRTMPGDCQLASLHPELVAVDASRDVLLEPVYWCFSAGDRRLLHSFLLGKNPGLAIKDIQSPYGYGGPLSNSDDSQFLRMADDAFMHWARENSVVAEFLRFHPLISHRKWYAGRVAHNRDTVSIDLSKDLLGQYRKRRRPDVERFLDSGLTVRRVSPESMQVVFPVLYRENMDRVGAAPDYYFPQSYLEALFSFGGTDNWLVFAGDTPIAGAVILTSAVARVAEYHLGADRQGSGQRAIVGLLHAAAAHYQSLCFERFYLGGGRSTAPDDSLLFFKQGFSPLTNPFLIGSRVLEAEDYARLEARFPARAATGRVLFYKGQLDS